MLLFTLVRMRENQWCEKVKKQRSSNNLHKKIFGEKLFNYKRDYRKSSN